MGKYLLRRILQMIPVVLGTTLLVYALVFALPGDPVKAMFGDKPVNEAVAAQIRAEYHLDQPFIVQYFIYLKNALTPELRRYLRRAACSRRNRPRLPGHHPARPDGVRVRGDLRCGLRHHLGPQKGQVVRHRHPDRLPAAYFRADLRHRLCHAICLWYSVGDIAGDGRRRPRLPRPAHAGHGARIGVDGLHHPTDPLRKSPPTSPRITCAPRAPRACRTVRSCCATCCATPDSSRHLPGPGHRRPDGWCHDHRADLQHPRHRLPSPTSPF